MSVLSRNDGLTSWTASPSDANFFNGAVMHGTNSYDPFVTGYSFIKWIKVPNWVTQDIGADFVQLAEKNFKAFSGLNDIELETQGVTSGFTSNELHYATKIGNKPTDFALKYQEHSGSPLTKTYNKWVSGIRDPRTGIATYPKTYGLDYHSSNHTGTLLYIVTRPDSDNIGKKIVEFASLITHVTPKKIILNHFNYESGNHDFVEQEQNFSGYMNFGSDIEKFALDTISSMWQVNNMVHENNTANIIDKIK